MNYKHYSNQGPILISLRIFYYEESTRQSYPSTDLDWPLRLQEVEAPKISRQSAHEGRKVVNPT